MRKRLMLYQLLYLCWDCSVDRSPRFYARWLTTLSKDTHFLYLYALLTIFSRSIGLDGTEKAFAKPIMMLLLMFLGMCPAAIFYVIQKYYFTNPEDRKDVRYVLVY